MPWNIIQGVAETATKQRQAAYERMLAKELRMTPQALPPAQEESLRAGTEFERARAAALPKQTALAQQEANIAAQQAATRDFEVKSQRFLDMTDLETGKPYLGMETQWHQLNSELLGKYGGAFKSGGLLVESGGETPEEIEQLNLIREYVNNPTSENLKKVKQYYEPGVPKEKPMSATELTSIEKMAQITTPERLRGILQHLVPGAQPTEREIQRKQRILKAARQKFGKGLGLDIDMKISQKIKALRTQINPTTNRRWTDEEIANALREKGIDPILYGLK